MFVEEKRQGEVQVPESAERKVLLRAAEILEENGWCQGQLMKRPSRPQRLLGAKPQYCAWGALYAAENCFRDGANTPSEIHRAANALERTLGPKSGWCGLADWNDQPGRTKADVVNLMRSVAATL